MKPICLIVKAFGPYAGEQVFDFRQLDGCCLFLITGPTGSGKTTVLDAICYALYGDTSGRERDATQMRSQHSDPAVPTEVTFDFALGAQHYRVWRKPQQDRPKKKGEGVKTEAAQAMLWKRTGLTDDTVDGEPLATRAGEVTAKIEELLGFRSAQFRQVVLLPQDKFRELLLADSHQRQEILETLFRTEIYRLIEQEMKDACKAIRDQLGEIKIRRDTVLRLAQVENEVELGDRLAAVEAQLTQVAKELDARRKEKVAADGALQVGRDAQAKLLELDEANKALAKLAAREKEISEKQARHSLGLKARDLRDAETQRDRRAEEAQKARRDLEGAVQRQVQAQEQVGKAQAELARQQQRQGEAETQRKEQTRLESLVQRVKRLIQAQSDLAGLEEAAKKLISDHDQAVQKLADLAKQREQADKDLTAADKLACLVDARRTALGQANIDHANRVKLNEARAQTSRLTSERDRAVNAAHDAQQELDNAVIDLQSKEKALQCGFAGHLAKSLKRGEPCPVCGSKDHPAPAKAAEDTPAPAELDQLRETLKSLEKSRKAADKKEASLEKELAVAIKEAESLAEQLGDKSKAKVDNLAEELERRRRELVAAEQAQAKAGELQKAITQLEQHKLEAARQADALQARVREQEATVQSHKGTVGEREAEVPPELRDPDALKIAIDRTKASVRQLEDDLAAAHRLAAAAGEATAGCAAAVKTMESVAAEAGSAAQADVKSFKQRLLQAGFDTETRYKVSKLVDEQISVLEQEIDRYQEDVAAVRDRQQRAAELSKGLHRPDISAMESSASQAQNAVEDALRRQTALAGRRTQITDWQKSLADDGRVMADLDNKYRVIGYIADVANGTNPQNITFQRFVLGALLDDVLVAASQRLKIMSKGRYLLQRQRDPADRRRAAGLDLEVHDAYTGQTRPVCTLSGGESFLAALSLALGLADVVQSYAGGIYLDTMFIDEGFGSLDAEALDAAMHALIDLQKGGRIVGIISHVAELKERIDVRLEVSAGKSGSTARFVKG